MIISQLNAEQTYKNLNSYPDHAIMNKSSLTDLQRKYFEASNFCGLPKIFESVSFK